jgi:hypothetical protein
MDSRTIYMIFVRPRGSSIWTQHININKNPWRASHPDKANEEAVTIANMTKYCTRVVSIRVPKLPDSIGPKNYAVLADGDTLYVPSI